MRKIATFISILLISSLAYADKVCVANHTHSRSQSGIELRAKISTQFEGGVKTPFASLDYITFYPMGHRVCITDDTLRKIKQSKVRKLTIIFEVAEARHTKSAISPTSCSMTYFYDKMPKEITAEVDQRSSALNCNVVSA